MERVKVVRKGEFGLQELVDEVRNCPEAFECGAIACYVGIVRGVGKNGSKVQKFSFEAREEEVIRTLTEMRRKILEEDKNIKDLLIYLVVDDLEPKDETVFIVAIGKHRYDAINATKKAIDEIKTKQPIRKKEYTEKGSYWV